MPSRALSMTNDPTSAWEITRAAQGEPETLIGLESRSAPGLYTDTPPPKREGTVRFVCISDTHSYESKTMAGPTAFDNIPDGDVLLHCGDFTNMGRLEEVMSFAKWFGALPHKRKIVIAGNHDLSLHGASYAATSKRFGGMGKLGQEHDPVEVSAKARAVIAGIPDCEYLMDSGTSVEGITVWGSPWQPEFCDWAFNLPRGAACRQKWSLIPEGTDVVLTHGPPLGHGDKCCHGGHAGCADLLDELQRRVKPQYHCFGHIHEGWGVTTDGATRYVNASTCNIRYKPINQPIVFDIPKAPAVKTQARAQDWPVATAAPAPATAAREATCAPTECCVAEPARSDEA